jgi:DNA-binding MarR family transcriptional regulator
MTPERKYQVLDLISKSPRLSQRELANTTGVSLGLINITLKRLIQTGHIKVSNINRRKVEYVLTTKGFSEITKRSYQYISKTINTFSEYQKRLNQLVQEMVQSKQKKFVILGNGEVASLMEMALKSGPPDVTYRYLKPGQSSQPHEILLDCRLSTESGGVGISVLKQLIEAKESAPSSQTKIMSEDA